MKSRKIITAILISALVSTSFFGTKVVSASDLGSTSEITREENGNVTIVTQNNKQIRKYSSTDSATTKDDSRVTIDASFIDDKFSSEMTTILSLKGFMPSKREIRSLFKSQGFMEWPFKYTVDVKNQSLDESVKIVDSVPKNTIFNKDVTNSISYSIGGGIDISKESSGKASASASLNANYAVSKSISYVQPDYNTVQLKDTNNIASWKTEFAETRDGYNIHSWNPVYGNQMFMRTRYSGTSTDNFLPDYQLSSLITGGFSPNFGLVLTAPNGTKKSRIEISLGRQMNLYRIAWDTEWQGKNWDYGFKSETVTFELDWENHTVRKIN